MNIALLLAGGTGQRFGAAQPKQFVHLGGVAIVKRTIARFVMNKAIDGVVIVCHRDYLQQISDGIEENWRSRVMAIEPGGATRQASAARGLRELPSEARNVLIHDAVRPLVDTGLIDRVISALVSHHAVVPVIPVTDTIYETGENGNPVKPLDRSRMVRIQTPQGFRVSTIREAHRRAEAEAISDATDDCTLVRRYRLADIFPVPGAEMNIKITRDSDLLLAEAWLRTQKNE